MLRRPPWILHIYLTFVTYAIPFNFFSFSFKLSFNTVCVTMSSESEWFGCSVFRLWPAFTCGLDVLYFTPLWPSWFVGHEMSYSRWRRLRATRGCAWLILLCLTFGRADCVHKYAREGTLLIRDSIFCKYAMVVLKCLKVALLFYDWRVCVDWASE